LPMVGGSLREILLKVALNTKNQSINQPRFIKIGPYIDFC
jgi:hypothetical protein